MRSTLRGFTLLLAVPLAFACTSTHPARVSRRPTLAPPSTDVGARIVTEPITVPAVDPTASAETFSGFYEHCDLYCLSVQLNTDGSFVYTPRVTGTKYPPLAGQYHHLGGGLLFATTSEQSPLPHVSATRAPGIQGIRVTVRYAVSQVGIPAADVSVDCEGMSAYSWADEQGTVIFPCLLPVRKLVVSKCGFNPATVEITDPLANSFDVWLQGAGPYLRGQLWLVTGTQLLVLNERPLQLQSRP